MLKRIIPFLVLVFFLVGGCSNNTVTSSDTISPNITYGNSNGNIANGGYIINTQLKGYNCITYVNENPSKPRLVRFNSDSKAFETITNDAVTYMNVYDDYIYYVNLFDNHIYCIKYDGNDRKTISDYICKSLFLVNNRLYYTAPKNDAYILYSINIDGTDKKEIIESNSPTFNVDGNDVYFWKNTDEIACYNMNNKQQSKVMDNVTDRFQYYDGFIYAVSTQNQLYKTDTNEKKIMIISEMGKRFLVYDNKIYYIKPSKESASGDKGKIYQSDLNGSDVQKLDDTTLNTKSFILACDENIFTIDGITNYMLSIK